MINKIFEIKDYLAKFNLIFWYNGPISQILVGEIGDIIKKSLLEESGKRVMVKVFAILVELMQNIIKYSIDIIPLGSEGKEISMRAGLISVGFEDGYYFVISGNKIENDNIERIRERLDVLAEMDREAQKEFYKSLRRKDPDERSKGAGIGFVEIARKASKPIEYSFKKIDGETSYFSLKVLVKLDLPDM